MDKSSCWTDAVNSNSSDLSPCDMHDMFHIKVTAIIFVVCPVATLNRISTYLSLPPTQPNQIEFVEKLTITEKVGRRAFCRSS